MSSFPAAPNASKAGGGGGTVTTPPSSKSMVMGGTGNGSTTGFASKGTIYTIENSLYLDAISWAYDASTGSDLELLFSICVVSGDEWTIDEVVYQEPVIAEYLGTTGTNDVIVMALGGGGVLLEAGTTYALLLTASNKTVSYATRVFINTGDPGDENDDFTFEANSRFQSILPIVGQDTRYASAPNTAVEGFLAYRLA